MNEHEILKLYDDGWSTYSIAEKYDTYPNKINRILKKNGRQLRSLKDAQTLAIASGRHKHPTKGTKRSEKVKTKISESAHRYWQNASKEIKEKRTKQAKQQWGKMTEADKADLRTRAAQAVRQAAKDGSKMEKFLLDKLRKNGYNVVFHHPNLIPDKNLEVDIYLPELNVVIEIDGPTHFLPIWGEENLQRHIKSDSHKSGLLLNQGVVLIRIKHIAKNVSYRHKLNLWKQVVEVIQKIKNKFPSRSERYIELEIS